MQSALQNSIYNTFKKCFRQIGLPVLFFGFLNSCVEDRNLAQYSVIAHFPSEPTTLHPVNGIDASFRYVQEYAQKTITRIDMRTLKQIPVLVKGLAEISENGLEYSYELRDDVKWDDGNNLTVDDVIFTLKIAKCPLTANTAQRSSFDNIKDIIKDKNNPAKFTLIAKKQYYKNPHLLDEIYIIQQKAWDSAGIFNNVHIWEMDDTAFSAAKIKGLESWMAEFNKGETGRNVNKVNGLGPYKITNWETGSSITLERKKNWWGEKDTSVYNKAYPEKIIFRYFNDDAAIYLALKKQTVDVVTFISTASFLKLRNDTAFTNNYHSGFTDQYNYNFIGMNMKPDGTKHKPYFNDVRVRRAMNYLVPVDDIINTIVQGKATRQASFVQPVNKEYYNNDLPIIKYDLEKGKQLLIEAGWVDSDKDGIRDKMINGKKVPFTFEYTYVANPSSKEVTLMIKDALYKAGIKMIPNPVDGGKLVSSILSHDFDMAAMAWSGSAVPEDPEQIFHTSNWANQGYNFVGFGNAETDKMLEESSKETDPAKRAILLKKLQKVVYDEAPYVFTYTLPRKIAIHKRFENAGMYAERPGVMLNNLKLKEK